MLHGSFFGCLTVDRHFKFVSVAIGPSPVRHGDEFYRRKYMRADDEQLVLASERLIVGYTGNLQLVAVVVPGTGRNASCTVGDFHNI